MAGYLFTFGDEESLHEAISIGSYSTLMNPGWSEPVASTLGDYVTMKPGDNIYFFSKRTVYGIGEVVEILPDVTVAENYKGATQRERVDYAFINLNSLMSEPVVETNSGTRVKRWVIVFRPSPHFFKSGIDMDDLLMSNPRAFRALRVFQQRSFIKLDDEENLAFKAAILRRNLDAVRHPSEANTLNCDYASTLERYRSRIEEREVGLDITGLLAEARLRNGALTSEMLLEVGVLYQMAHGDWDTKQVFGSWDFISHQVAASPMKPVGWMDRIDVFAFRYIDNFEPIIEKFGIIELKKGTATGDDIQQVMKYVDWVNNEYGNRDYSLIRAFLVAHDFDEESIASLHDTAERRYTLGRPSRSEVWHDLTYVSYHVSDNGHVEFAVIPTVANPHIKPESK